MKKAFLLISLSVCSALSVLAQISDAEIRASYGISYFDINSKGATGSELSVAYVKELDLFHSETDRIEVAPEFVHHSINEGLTYDGKRCSMVCSYFAIPVSYLYRVKVGDIAVRAHAGLNARVNLGGKIENDDVAYHIFDDEDSKRIQLGAQTAGGIEYSNIYVGISYHWDLTPMLAYDSTKWKLSSLRLSVGLKF